MAMTTRRSEIHMHGSYGVSRMCQDTNGRTDKRQESDFVNFSLNMRHTVEIF